jgi:hypothetical protein
MIQCLEAESLSCFIESVNRLHGDSAPDACIVAA